MRLGGRRPIAEAARRILEVVSETSTRLPPVHRVAARPNVRRLAALAPQRDGSITLNLSRAVVEAGEEAWRLVAPALEGDRKARSTLRAMVVPTLEEAAWASRAGRRSPPCQGSLQERQCLQELVEKLRGEDPWGHTLPQEMELRISRRMTRTLGTCLVRGPIRRITISQRLFRMGMEDILEETVRHEVAHLADALTSPGGRMSHGKSWKLWAHRFGARPERKCTREETIRLDGKRR